MTDVIDNETGEVTEGQMIVSDENLRTQIARMDKQFAAALPPHIPVERFTRVVQTALTGNPDLQTADRASLFEAAMKAAQDGLLPDGRDGALVIFNTKVKRNGRDEWIKKVQWMPMVGGILKKVRNSGELLSISAHVVYTKDKFFYSLGDEEKIEHTPLLDDERGVPMCVYAIAKTKDGGIYREVMTLKDVQKVRNVSKAKDSGPWTQWWDEMARKTVIRRLAKRLPTSADLDDLLRQDDDLYDFSGKRADPAPFEPVKNPLKDDPADKPKAANDKPAVQTVKEDPISTGIIKMEGNTFETGSGHGIILGSEPASTQDEKSDTDPKATESVAGGAATDTASTVNNAQAPAPEAGKPYSDAVGYLAYMRKAFDEVKGPTGLTEVWSATRADRARLLGDEQLDAITEEKVARMKAMKDPQG